MPTPLGYGPIAQGRRQFRGGAPTENEFGALLCCQNVAIILSILKCMFYLTWSEKNYRPQLRGFLAPPAYAPVSAYYVVAQRTLSSRMAQYSPISAGKCWI